MGDPESTRLQPRDDGRLTHRLINRRDVHLFDQCEELRSGERRSRLAAAFAAMHSGASSSFNDNDWALVAVAAHRISRNRTFLGRGPPAQARLIPSSRSSQAGFKTPRRRAAAPPLVTSWSRLD